jgi:hypothetical protein
MPHVPAGLLCTMAVLWRAYAGSPEKTFKIWTKMNAFQFALQNERKVLMSLQKDAGGI